MRVLIVEDNDRLAKLMAEGLQRRGFSCDIAGNLTDADSAMDGAAYDAIILDLGLPDGDGAAPSMALSASVRLPAMSQEKPRR